MFEEKRDDQWLILSGFLSCTGLSTPLTGSAFCGSLCPAAALSLRCLENLGEGTVTVSEIKEREEGQQRRQDGSSVGQDPGVEVQDIVVT